MKFRFNFFVCNFSYDERAAVLTRSHSKTFIWKCFPDLCVPLKLNFAVRMFFPFQLGINLWFKTLNLSSLSNCLDFLAILDLMTSRDKLLIVNFICLSPLHIHKNLVSHSGNSRIYLSFPMFVSCFFFLLSFLASFFFFFLVKLFKLPLLYFLDFAQN